MSSGAVGCIPAEAGSPSEPAKDPQKFFTKDHIVYKTSWVEETRFVADFCRAEFVKVSR
jgi:hypothetical protein